MRRSSVALAAILALVAAPAFAAVDCKPGDKGIFGGDGTSVEQAIVICGAKSEAEGVRAERDYLSEKFPGFDFSGQHLLLPAGRAYDQLDIVLADGSKRSVYFDITAFFGIDFR